MINGSSVEIVPPATPVLVTAIEFEREKHPSRLPAFMPTSAPVNSPLKLRCQIRQTPSPAPSRSNGDPSGRPRMFKSSSVITHALFSPSFPSSATSIGSATPSPAQISVKSSVEISPPATPFLVTVMAFESEKQPSRSFAFMPTSAPASSPLKLKCQMRETPPPAPSRSNGPPSGRPRIIPASSVITHALFSPSFPSSVTLIGSATPSPAQISVGSSVVISPPIASQGQSSPAKRVTVIAFERE